MVVVGLIRWYLRSGEDWKEEKKREKIKDKKIGVIEMKEEEWGLRKRILNEGRSIKKEIKVMKGEGGKEDWKVIEIEIDNIVIIEVMWIERNWWEVIIVKNGERVSVRKVINWKKNDGEKIRK